MCFTLTEWTSEWFLLSAKNALEIADRAKQCALEIADPALSHERTATFQMGPSSGFDVFCTFVFLYQEHLSAESAIMPVFFADKKNLLGKSALSN
mgnify:CR=1 FL=1